MESNAKTTKSTKDEGRWRVKMGRALLCERHSEVFADFPGQIVIDLSVAGNRRATVLLRIRPS